MCDLFILAAEPSGDLHGANLIKELLSLRPHLNIAAVAGPRMRAHPIQALFPMEHLQVMGFIDVLAALPRIAKQFFIIRSTILQLNPQAVVCIDYPGFNLRLEKSLRKKKYTGKLIHYICPTVWAWGKKRIVKMEQTLDLLLSVFPFEKQCFSSSNLRVEYIGHPLASRIPASIALQKKENILALFPGSRKTEIERNFPIQLAAATKLRSLQKTFDIAVSIAQPSYEPWLRALAKDLPITFYAPQQTYELMQKANAAMATSGTVVLELALHKVPTVVNFAIKPLDCWIAQKIFRIALPFYSIVNIILSTEVFPELFGPHLTEENLFAAIHKLWTDRAVRSKVLTDCGHLRTVLSERNASEEAARSVISLAF